MSEERWTATDMRQLVGRRVLSIHVAPAESEVVFRTDRGDVRYSAEADCCSETWVSDILGVNALIGHTVTATEAREMGDPGDGRSRQESDDAYGITLTTEAGHADVLYRNSSNGYYGGHLFFDNNPASITDEWKAIDGDFSA